MYEELVLIAFTVLIPITPAYILYKALPAEASVRGPLKGFTINLSGAFAGYFALVLLIFGFHSAQPKKDLYEVWVVQGQLKSNSGLPVKEAIFSLLPVNLDANGKFETQIYTMPAVNGDSKFPTLRIDHPGYQPLDIDLNQSNSTYGAERRRISKSGRLLNLVDDVVLKPKESAGDPGGYEQGQRGQVAQPTSETGAKQ